MRVARLRTRADRCRCRAASGLSFGCYAAEAPHRDDWSPRLSARLLNLADSALHAPAAGFGDDDFYPDFVDKAAVLVRLAGNHPLPDGNKRTAWVALRVFVDLNGWAWDPS